MSVDGFWRYTCSSMSCIASGLLALALLPLAVKLPLCVVSRVYLSAAPPAQVLLFPLVYSLALAQDVVSGPLSFAALGALRLRVAWWRRPGWLVSLTGAAIVSVAASLTLVLAGLVVGPRLLGAAGLLARAVELAGLAFAAFNSMGVTVGCPAASCQAGHRGLCGCPIESYRFPYCDASTWLRWCPVPFAVEGSCCPGAVSPV